jgi:hypothetical protein
VKGKRQPCRGDLKQKYAHMKKEKKDRCGLGGIKLLTEI